MPFHRRSYEQSSPSVRPSSCFTSHQWKFRLMGSSYFVELFLLTRGTSDDTIRFGSVMAAKAASGATCVVQCMYKRLRLPAPPCPLHDFKALYRCCIIIIIIIIRVSQPDVGDVKNTLCLEKRPTFTTCYNLYRYTVRLPPIISSLYQM